MATEVVTPTPDPDLDAEVGLDSAENEAAAGANTRADKDAQTEPDRRLAQAEYTRAQQAFALMKQELGLDGKTTREQLIEKIREIKAAQAAAATPDTLEELDPRVAEYEQRLQEAQLRMVEAVYPDYAQPAIAFVNLARTSDNLEELVGAFAAAVQEFAEAGGQPAQEPAVAYEDEGGEEPVDVDLPGDTAPSGTPRISAEPESAAYRRRESPVVSAVRSLFAESGRAR